MVKANDVAEEDAPLCRFLIGLLFKGNDFNKVIRWSGADPAKAKVWHGHLNASGYFEGKKVVMDEGFMDGKNSDISFYLMMLVAQGFIERRG